jgi:hypothetical protein
MASLQGVHNVSSVAIPTLLTTAAASLLTLVAPSANQRVKIISYELGFDGTNSANTPAQLQIARTTGGTYTNNAVAAAKLNDPTGTGETLGTTSKNTCTVAPTVTDVLERTRVPVFGGSVMVPQNPGQEILIPGSTTVFLTWQLAAPQPVNADCTVKFEE